MAYARRRRTTRAPSRSSRGSYSRARSTRRAAPKRRRSVSRSSGSRTVRVVIQTVAAPTQMSPYGSQVSAAPLQARF